MKFNTYLSVKEGVWLTGEMSDLIKFQFYFKTFISRDDPPIPYASFYLKIYVCGDGLDPDYKDKPEIRIDN